MSVDLATLALKVEALEVDAASKKLDNLTAAGGRTEKAAGGVTSAFKAVRAALAAVAFAQSIRQAVELADSYTRIEGRLKLVTSSATELASVQNALYAISQRSRAEYLATADVYNRFAQATKGQGIAQAELLGITETLNKAFAISGASTSEAAGAMVQLSQGFSSGVLRGDEFNTVMETGGRVVDLLADYLGVGRGELRGMAEDGKLTSDVLRNAIVSGAAKVNEEFDKMPTTVGQAGVVLQNVLGAVLNDANKSSEATAGLSRSILELASTIEANKPAILSVFTGIVESAGWAIERVAVLANSIKGMAAVAAGALSVVDFAQMNPQELTQWMTDFDHGMAGVRKEITETAAKLKELGEEDPELVDEAEFTKTQQHFESLRGQIAAYENQITGASINSQAQVKGTIELLRQKAQQEKDVAAATSVGTGVQKLSADALEKLHGRLTPVHEAQVQYKKDLEEIEKAHKSGQLVGAVYSEALKTAKDRLDKATGASKEHKAALTEAGKAAKASAQEYQSILDNLEPARVEQERYNEALTVLNKLDPTHETERYKDALKSLNSSLSVNIQAERDRIGELEHLKQAQEDVATYTMTANERQIYDLEQLNAKMMEQVDWLVQSKNITEEAGEAYREAFGEKLQSEIQAVTDDAGKMGEMFDDVAKSIQGAFSDMFLDMMNDTDNAMDSIGDMFKKLLAEMATMAILNPIIVPIVSAIGSGMGISDSGIAKALGMDTSQLSSGGGFGDMMQSSIIGEGYDYVSGLFGGSAAGSSAAYSSAAYGSSAWDLGSVYSEGAYASSASELGSSASASGWGGLSTAAQTGWSSGALAFVASLVSGDDVDVAAVNGIGAGGGAYLGAQAGTMIWPGVGTAVGGVLGGILGALGAGSLLDNGPDTFQAGYMSDAVGVNYNAITGMTPTTAQFTGGDTDSQIAAIYAQAMRAIQQAFDANVTALAETLPEEMSASMIESLAGMDLLAILDKVSAGEIEVGNVDTWLAKVAEDYAEGLSVALGEAFGNGLASFISAKGAEGLVGDSAAWAVLSDAVKENITASFQEAATQIAGGDIDAGLASIQSVTNAIAAIESAMSPISEIIATNGMSDYELSLRSINQQFDAYSDALQAAGVDMAKYTDLETARGIKLAEIQKAEDARLAALAEEAAQAAAKIAEEAAQQAAALAEQRQSLEIQIMEATGDSAGALAANRAIELAAMDESLRPLQERIYALQDEEKATEEAAEAVRLINEQLERLASAKAPIEEIIATNGLSAYDLSLRSVNQKFEDYGQALVDAGVVLADYPQYYQAWAIELGKVVDPTLQAAADTTAKIASAIREGLQTALTEANSALQDAESSLRDAFGAEQDRLDNAHKSALDGMNDQLKSSRDHLSSMSSLSKSLGSSLSSMSLGTAAAAMVTRASAQSALSAALTAARNGNMSPAQSLDGSMSALVESDMGMFATAEDYQRDYYKTYNQISELSKIAGSETSKAEDTVSAIDRQITAENEWYEAETQILANQLNTILGINTAVLGMAEASKEYSEAQIEVTRATWELSEFDRKQQHQELVDEIKQLRADLKAQNDQIAINTKKTAEIMDKWDYDGMPLETVA